MTITRLIALAVVASLDPLRLDGAGSEVKFWLKGSPDDITGCIAGELAASPASTLSS